MKDGRNITWNVSEEMITERCCSCSVLFAYSAERRAA